MAIVTPFVQVGTYPTRNFATLGPLSLRPPFTGASIKSFALRLPHHLTFRHRAGVTPYTSAYAFAECCVFSKQSQPPGHCNPRPLRPQGLHVLGAYLLPKLRYYFA